MLWISAALPQEGSNGMWRTKVQVCSEDLSVRVELVTIILGSGMASEKPYCVLGDTWVAQSRKLWVEKSQALSSYRLMSLKAVLTISLVLPTVVSR